MRSRRAPRFLDLVRSRRATKRFEDAAVDADDRWRILRAGLESPSSYNLQPWRFIVVRDAGQRARLRRATLDQSQIEEAPVVIVACGTTADWRERLDEVVALGLANGSIDRPAAERKRVRVTADLSTRTDPATWITRQVMIAATTMM